MPDFRDLFDQYKWQEVKDKIYDQTSREVERALTTPRPNLEDFMALVSPAADAYLEEMAAQSHARTLRRFGNTIQLFAPMYLSNECQNICTYCGFSLDNKIRRKTLTSAELDVEIDALKSL